MKESEVLIVDFDSKKIEDALAGAKTALPEETFHVLETIVQSYLFLRRQLARKRASVERLQRMLFGPRSEKRRLIPPPSGESPSEGNSNAGNREGAGKAKPPPPPGHGRNGEDSYRGAETKNVPHEKLKAGERCPGCLKGKVYEQRERPGILVRVTGQPPLAATIYHLQKLRCNLCQEIFSARPPEGVGSRKYDESSASLIALFKYGGGLPFNRLHRLQSAMGIPLPTSTQWEIVRDAARDIVPAFEELERQAAQGKVLHNDDTTMKILAWMGKRREASLRERSQSAANGEPGEPPDPKRTGIFTSGVISRLRGRQIALFFTGRRHAGENLNALLDKRDLDRAPPIQMSDALSRNIPKDFKTVLANCLAHGRRQFVEQAESFPAECGHILDVLAKVYKYEALAKKRQMTAAERLKFHRRKSAPAMKKLNAWMRARIDLKEVEPNSGLGEAIGYMLKHWEELTLFLRHAGAPLDNNVCERALKKAILHRKNSMFYKTDNGARVGDLFMSLIHTCDLNAVDPFDYLTELQRHAEEVREHPKEWLPWTYRKVLPCIRTS